MEQYLRIGEVAELFDISIRALRLYDRIKLFQPEQVDPETGYRYYTADQMPILNTILVFKGIGFQLQEIHELMVNGMDPGMLLERLQKKQDALENEIRIARFNKENVIHLRKVLEEQSEQATLRAKPSALNAYNLSRLICLQNRKVDSTLSEVLWL